MGGDYQEPPPPPPEPPPDEPPPDDPPPDDELLGVLPATVIVLFIKLSKLVTSKAVFPEYHEGAGIAIVSNFLIHFLETPKTYVYGKMS